MEGGGRAWLKMGNTRSDANIFVGSRKEPGVRESAREIDAVFLCRVETGVNRGCRRLREPTIRRV